MENEMIREAMEEAVTDSIPAAQEIVNTVPTLEHTIDAAPAPAKHSFGKTLGCLTVLGVIIAIKPLKNWWEAKKEAKRQEEERKLQAMVDARVDKLFELRFGAPENPEAKDEQIVDSEETTETNDK